MWKLYSDLYSGIRIGLREKPFKKYINTAQDIKRIFPNACVEDVEEDILPLEECFNDKYTVLNRLYEKNIEEVVYTDNKKLLQP